MTHFSFPIFNGLYKHGGSPIILGHGVELKKNFYQINSVPYSPHFMLSGAAQYSVGFVSMFGKLLKLSTEATSLL